MNHDQNALEEINKRLTAALSVFKEWSPVVDRVVMAVLVGAYADGLLIEPPKVVNGQVVAIVRGEIKPTDINFKLTFDSKTEGNA